MSAILVTIDGIQTQSPLAKSMDGFWSLISPNIDAMEEVTVSTATPGAEASGQGAIQIRFTTKSGTEKYAGSFFETWRHPVLYANTFFNKVNRLPVNHIILNDYGGNVGGPIALPGLDGGKKAFFFTNFDELRQASELSRRRTILTPSARTGRFSYTSGGAVREVNVLALAAQNGQLASPDPTIARLLAEIAAATTTTGSTAPNADSNTSTYTWNSPDDLLRRHWTSRVDRRAEPSASSERHLQLQQVRARSRHADQSGSAVPGTARLRLQYVVSQLGDDDAQIDALVEPRERGHVRRLLGLERRRPRAGAGGVCESRGPQPDTCRGQQGGTFAGLAPASPGAGIDANMNGNHSASNPNLLWSVADKLSWQRGRHGLQFGGELTGVKARRQDQQVVPAASFGAATTADPAAGLFTTTNFPGASNANLADAGFLYGLLTGRVASITTEFALDPATGQYLTNGMTDRADAPARAGAVRAGCLSRHARR